MIRPILSQDGTNNWPEVDWDDPDIGEYTNLCPDKRRAEFEHGSLLIVAEANRGPVENIFSPSEMPPSKIKRELDQLIAAFDRLSPDTILHLAVTSGFSNPIEVMKEYLHRARERVEEHRPGPDKSRRDLGENAWAIWVAHGGSLEGKGSGKGDSFVDYVDRMLCRAGFITESKKKNRASAENLVRDIWSASKTRPPRPWHLW